jgi:hypothetical protein
MIDHHTLQDALDRHLPCALDRSNSQ